MRAAAPAVAGGLLVAAALPPWGFWPLAFAGIALYGADARARTRDRRGRVTRGWLFAAAWLFPGMCWMWFLTAPGYLVAASLFATFHCVAALTAPTGRWRVVGRPAAHTLAEALRFCFPFGGVPLASLAIGQAAGPFATVVRVGGPLLLTWFVLQTGFALAELVPGVAQRAGRSLASRRPGLVPTRAAPTNASLAAGALFTCALVWLAVAPFADGSGATGRALRIAAVQGGGEQGTHAIYSSAELVLERHLAATATIAPGAVDAVVWPENVIDVPRFSGSDALIAVAGEARRLGVPMVVGVTEDDGERHFLNAQVVVTPDGEVVDRYDKVRRVPFGEYMPLRGLLQWIGAPTELVPRDATAGTGPAVLRLPDGTRLATVISWEVFFAGRANEGVEAGGNLILNPTNGSSYTWTVLQSQQVAASRLRAIEQGRWVVQVSPTGFSAFVTPGGEVLDRTSVSEQKVIVHEVPLRSGRTWYSYVGDLPWVALAALTLLVLAFSSWRDARRPTEADGQQRG